MNDFRIEVAPDAAEFDAPRSVTIHARKVVFTRLLRPGGSALHDAVRVAPAVLAWWLVDHWWRLRWESVPPEGRTAEWRLAHDLSSVGGGYAWPRLAVWSEGERVGFMQQADPLGVVGPVRYVTDALVFVPGQEFEAGVDAFLALAADPEARIASDWRALAEHVAALGSERENPDATQWRRFEAQLGYDPDDAPDTLIEDLLDLAVRFGASAVGEAAQAAPGPRAAETLRHEVLAATTIGVRCSLADAVHEASPKFHQPGGPRWAAAEAAAAAVRRAFGIQGPLVTARLAEVLGTTPDVFGYRPPGRDETLAYGLRVSEQHSSVDRVALRALAPRDRRFELVRALGDAIWSGGDALGPLARTRTARQQFQRAFAQALLCPFPELVEYLDIDSPERRPSNEDMSAAAHHFLVSESVVKTLLVNKKVLPREILSDPAEAEVEATVGEAA